MEEIPLRGETKESYYNEIVNWSVRVKTTTINICPKRKGRRMKEGDEGGRMENGKFPNELHVFMLIHILHVRSLKNIRFREIKLYLQ